MDLYFDRGDQHNPVGHALVYFKVDTEPDKVYASYVVTLPIKSDLTKFLPPFLASHLGSLPLNDLSSFAMPPVPEPVEGFRRNWNALAASGVTTWFTRATCSPMTCPG